jgi:hypothetical protein
MPKTPRMMSLTTSLVLVIALLAAEWLYVRTFFRRVEPALIERVENSLALKIEFGVLHHWQVGELSPDDGARSRLALSAAVSAIHLAVMLGFAIGLLVVAAGVVTPLVWWHQRA